MYTSIYAEKNNFIILESTIKDWGVRSGPSTVNVMIVTGRRTPAGCDTKSELSSQGVT